MFGYSDFKLCSDVSDNFTFHFPFSWVYGLLVSPFTKQFPCLCPYLPLSPPPSFLFYINTLSAPAPLPASLDALPPSCIYLGKFTHAVAPGPVFLPTAPDSLCSPTLVL